MSYTPGPWKAEQRCDKNSGMRIPAWRICGPGLSGIIVDRITSDAVLGSTTAKQHANAEATAQLIASAPDLLVAAKAGLKQLWHRRREFSPADHEAMNLLSGAIAKATELYAGATTEPHNDIDR